SCWTLRRRIRKVVLRSSASAVRPRSNTCRPRSMANPPVGRRSTTVASGRSRTRAPNSPNTRVLTAEHWTQKRLPPYSSSFSRFESAVMAHERYTRTNQKLYFAGLALENWRQAEEQGGVNSLGLVQAEREASLFHLYGALLGLCHEVSGYYRLANANATQVAQLLDRSSQSSSPSPELGELMELAEQPESWVAKMLAAC